MSASVAVHPYDIPTRLAAIMAKAKALGDEVDSLVIGRRVVIQSDYNGQPYGRSKPSLKGREFRVTGAFLDENGVHLWLGGEMSAIRASDVDWIDNGGES